MASIILFVIVLWSGVFIQENLRNNGQEVILDTLPVDPRDILRGDYVDLAYEIGWGEKAVAFAKSLETSGPIYVLLTLGEDKRVTSYTYSTTKPDDGIYIRGNAIIEEIQNYIWEKDGEAVYQIEKQGSISFPQIEQYFVPEGKGWEIDRIGRQNSGKKLEVKIVTNNGRAQIIELLVDGTPVDFDTIESENPWTDEPLESEREISPSEIS